MESLALEPLLQLGFAAAIAGWLVRWMTIQQQKNLDRNATLLLNLQLYTSEMYRFLLVSEARCRKVEPLTDDELSQHHREAATQYSAAVDRLDSIKASIEKSLELL